MFDELENYLSIIIGCILGAAIGILAGIGVILYLILH